MSQWRVGSRRGQDRFRTTSPIPLPGLAALWDGRIGRREGGWESWWTDGRAGRWVLRCQRVVDRAGAKWRLVWGLF